MNLIDTAELYGGGHAEEIVGKAIKGLRDKIFVTSKFNPDNNTFKGVVRAVEDSLKRLNTDYIDLYQVHWPNPRIPIQETMEALDHLVNDGKIRNIGLSNFTLNEFLEAQAVLGVRKIVSNQVEYNLVERSIENDLLPYCKENGVTIIAYSPLDQGKIDYNSQKGHLLQRLAGKYQKSVSQIILRWLISHKPVVAIPKTVSMMHTKENADAARFDISNEDMHLINDTFKPQIAYVYPERIRITNEGKPIYRSLEEALNNSFDLIPSPAMLAENISKWGIHKPLRVVQTADKSGKYDYDLAGEKLRYWAWIIAFGNKTPIPVYVQ